MSNKEREEVKEIYKMRIVDIVYGYHQMMKRINKAIEYIEETQVHDYEFNEYVVQVKDLLEILKGEY